MEVVAIVISLSAAIATGIALGIKFSERFVNSIHDDWEQASNDLAAAIKERDELERQLEVMDELNQRALDSSAKWKREFDRADYAIDGIACALEGYHGETQGDDEQ